MPRRYHDYGPEFALWNMISSIGSWLLGAGFLLMTAYFLWSLWKGEKASSNPWNGKTLEWELPSPPTTHNFEKIPVITEGPYQYGVLKL